MPKDDPPFLQIIGGYGHRHAVAQHHANAELAELAREVGLDVGAGLGGHDEVSTGVDLLHDTFDFNQIVTGQVVLALWGAAG